MKQVFIILSVILLLASFAVSEESSCPADRAAKEGYNPFADFHHILAPVWHNSWPEKDYDALLASGPDFAEKFKDIAELKPELKNKKREIEYFKYRDQLGKLVAQFNEACQSKDKETAYKIMPDLHDSFEMAASALLPIHYPEFDGFVISVNLLLESHLAKNNKEGIIGTTETLNLKAKNLNKESIPEELQEQEELILKDFEKIQKIVLQLKECCDKDDMEKFKVHASELKKSVDKFLADYI